jgi:hypothetical protein
MRLSSLVILVSGFGSLTWADGPAAKPPYPPSPVLAGITWDWETYRMAAPGSDLWPLSWGADGEIYTAWGDGGGFQGTDQDGRVALGFARIEGPPGRFAGININGGKNPEHRPAFPKQGKTGGLLAVGDRLYAWLNTQNGDWPAVDQALVWSDDRGATWQRSAWVFPKGKGNFKPATFLNFGKGYTGVPSELGEYVYFYGQRQGNVTDTYLGRAPTGRAHDRRAYEFLSGLPQGRPRWSSDPAQSAPIFTDANGTGDLTTVVHVPGLRRYLLTNFHKGPGQLGVFDGPQPWGPWTTLAYEDRWGGMAAKGEGLTCSFPQKWMSADGLTLWCIFSVYGEGAKQGINAHDRFNLVKATLRRRSGRRRRPASPGTADGLEHIRPFSQTRHWIRDALRSFSKSMRMRLGLGLPVCSSMPSVSRKVMRSFPQSSRLS